MSQVRTTTFRGSKALKDLLVRLELVVLGGEVLAVEVDEFGAEQADAARIILLDRTHIAHAADVGEDVDGLAVQRGVGLALQLLQQGLLSSDLPAGASSGS